MTSVDDLKVGQWIALTYVENPPMALFFGGQRQTDHPQVDGTPLEVLAISLPFVCVANGKYRFSIDVRRCRFQKVNRRYADLMFSMDPLTFNGVVVVEDNDPMPEPLDDDSSAKGCCPMCGERLAERLDNETRTWFMVCRQCGFQGTVPGDNGEA